MKQISTENLFITGAWINQQSGEKLKILPPVTKLDDGRYKCELYIPTVNVHIASLGKSKIEAIDRLFTKAVNEIKKYCLDKGMEYPRSVIGDRIVICEEDDTLDILLNPKYTRKSIK